MMSKADSGNEQKKAMARRKSSTAAKASKVAKQSKKKDSRELVVTLNASNGEITKIEELVSAGKRRVVSESDLATLAGDDIVEDLCEVFEAAYIAGVRDGLEDALGDDISAGAPHSRRDAQESVGKEILRSGIRQIILRRGLRRTLERTRKTAPQNGAHAAS